MLFQIHHKMHMSLEMDPEITYSRRRAQKKESEVSTLCCFLLRQSFLVQKTARARGAVQEPPGIGIDSRLTLARHLFLKHFLERIFSQKSRNLKENGTQNGSQFCFFLYFFLRKANM